MALGIRNGFEVKPGELGQVLRRAAATGIDQEPGTKSYVKVKRLHYFEDFFCLLSILMVVPNSDTVLNRR